MDRNPWEQLLDTLYNLGGYGEWPTEETEQEIDRDVDLSQHLDLSIETIDGASITLRDRGLATRNLIEDGEENNRRMMVQLDTEGFTLAHDRVQAQRDQASNQAVTLLTFVLAFVGIAQAVALTARASSIDFLALASIIVTATAFVILIVTYYGLLKAGALDFSDLEP